MQHSYWFLKVYITQLKRASNSHRTVNARKIHFIENIIWYFDNIEVSWVRKHFVELATNITSFLLPLSTKIVSARKSIDHLRIIQTNIPSTVFWYEFLYLPYKIVMSIDFLMWCYMRPILIIKIHVRGLGLMHINNFTLIKIRLYWGFILWLLQQILWTSLPNTLHWKQQRKLETVNVCNY